MAIPVDFCARNRLQYIDDDPMATVQGAVSSTASSSLTGAKSCKAHGGAGTFDLLL